MKDGLIERIRSAGYWRVNIRPNILPSVALTFKECREIVEKSNVSLRGWSYPHVKLRNDDYHGYGQDKEYFENWTDWNIHLEFWRMFKSGQFLHYRNLWEDWEKPESGRRPPEKPISVVGAIYTLSEITEFASRLARQNIYTSGFSLFVTLGHAKDRELWVDEIRRSPFFEPKRSGTEMIELKRSFSATEVPILAADTALAMLLEFFDYFGWNPKEDQIRIDQDRLYNRQL